MSDHSSVQGAQTAAAQKFKEISEAAIRLLFQQSRDNATSKKIPTNDPDKLKANEQLFRSFYEKFRENGVDDATAQAAAADATLGIGAKDSPAVERANAQILANAQGLAKEYQASAAIAQDTSLPISRRRQALDRIDEIKDGLGIRGKSREEQVDTISNLLYPPEPQQTTAVAELAQPSQPEEAKQTASNSQSATETLRLTAQARFEQAGAKPETARLASYEFADQKGATPGLHTMRAHQEIEQHNVLKNMYQGVYEQHGVSSDVAARAADQLARGNGANRSNDVQQAHNQALNNISKGQQASVAPVEQSATATDSANRSPEDRPVTKPKVVNQTQRSPSSQPATPRPVSRTETVRSTKAKQTQEKPAVEENVPAAPKTPDLLWQKHSPTEQGAGRSDIDYTTDSAANDKRFAYNALLAGASKEDVKASLLRSSPTVQEKENPERHIDQIIGEAERLLLIANQQQSQPDIATDGTSQEQTSNAQQPPQASSQAAILPAVSKAQNNTGQATQVKPAPPSLSPEHIYKAFDASQGSGVFAAVSKQNARVNDQAIAQAALAAGYLRSDIEKAISENSPHAQNLNQESKGHVTYARRTVGKAKEALDGNPDGSDAKSEQKSEKTQVGEQSQDKQASKAAQNKPTKKSSKKSQKRTKVKSRGQGVEM